MDDSPHLVRVPKGGSDSPSTEAADASSIEAAEAEVRVGESRAGIEERKGIPVKVLALVIAAIVVGAGGLYVWAEYVRHWSTADIEDQVISDPIEATPGFRHSLAGRTVTVEGRVAVIETYSTTLGDLSHVYTRSSDYIALAVWGDMPYEVGDKIEMRVHFEWATCNDESHVYSPQIAFPWQALSSMGVVVDALSAVLGGVLIPMEIDSETVRLEVFDQYPALSLADSNCSLRAGTSSYMAEYIDLLGQWDYGREIDSIANLSVGTSENDLLEFVDLDEDGWITRGDYFELSGLERPEEDSGMRTYLLNIGKTNVTDPEYLNDAFAGSSYLVLTNRGILKQTYSTNGDNPITPYGRGSASIDGSQVTVTCDRLIESVSWDDIEIHLTDGTNFAMWYPSEDGLDSGTNVTQNLASVILNGTEISCSVTDLLGNGELDEGDYFVFSAPGGFPASEAYQAIVIFVDTYSRIFSADFQF